MKEDTMKSISLSWVLGAVGAFGLGMAAQACSSSSTSAAVDSGVGGSSSSGNQGSTGGSSTGGSNTGASSAASSAGSNKCYSAPADKVYAEDGGCLLYTSRCV